MSSGCFEERAIMKSLFSDSKLDKNVTQLCWFFTLSIFNFKKIIKLYYFKSKRWDIETSEGYLIKLSRNDVKKNLNLFVRLSNEDKFKNKLVIDFRQKDQIILNGK